jgi:hypothetical protein
MLLLLSAVLIISSCTHTSPFEEDYYFRSVGKRGDAVVTVNLITARELYEKSADDQKKEQLAPIIDRTDRLSAAVGSGRDPESLLFSGAAEGNFSKALVGTALSLSGDWKKDEEADITTYTDEAGSLRLASVESGLVLFSTDDLDDLYSYSYQQREILVPYEIAEKMNSGLFALYIEKPEDLMLFPFEIPDSLVESINSIYLVFGGQADSYSITGAILTDKRAAGRVISTTLKMDYLERVRALDSPPEDWWDDIVWEELDVMLEQMYISEEQVVDLFATVLEQL